MLELLKQASHDRGDKAALIWREQTFSYTWLAEQIRQDAEILHLGGLQPGHCVVLDSDFSPRSVSLLLALLTQRMIVVPVMSQSVKLDQYAALAGAQFHLHTRNAEDPQVRKLPSNRQPELLDRLRDANAPGLILFSSGSTGEPKGTVHDFSRLLVKFSRRRHDLSTLAFLLLDHIGGLDTLLYGLSNGSTLVIPQDRGTDTVCALIERHRVEVLPVVPTFLNLLSIDGCWRKYDLSSLKYVTFGAEVMPQSTLDRCVEMFPHAQLLQKYGTSEVGTLRSQSRARGSTWVRLGGEGYELRVRNGTLEIKAESSMLGYLNAPSPFTEDGWFKTGDRVEQDGEYLRFLGRDSDIINVGGRKVFPAEVEAVLVAAGNVAEAAVYGGDNAMMGQIVCARIRLLDEEDEAEARKRLRRFCKQKLAAHMVPVSLEFQSAPLSSERGKVLRRQSAAQTLQDEHR